MPRFPVLRPPLCLPPSPYNVSTSTSPAICLFLPFPLFLTSSSQSPLFTPPRLFNPPLTPTKICIPTCSPFFHHNFFMWTFHSPARTQGALVFSSSIFLLNLVSQWLCCSCSKIEKVCHNIVHRVGWGF